MVEMKLVEIREMKVVETKIVEEMKSNLLAVSEVLLLCQEN